MGKKDNSAQWISLSDMMTGLMLVFLLLSIAVISEVNKKEKELEIKKLEIIEYEELLKKKEDNKNKILLEYNNIKEEIHKDLIKAFEEKKKEWDMQIDDNLVIKFENDGLFEPNKKLLTKEFKKIINEFIPSYLDIINNPSYDNKITEVRIEGHAGDCKYEEYMYCLRLSQERTTEVIKYIYNRPAFIKLTDKEEAKVKFLITSNGMSNGRNLDKDGEYVYYSSKPLDSKLSRRVEFKIVTNSEQLAEQLLNNIKK